VIFGWAMIAIGLVVAQSGGRLNLLLGYGHGNRVKKYVTNR
jgi:hypothetical protein